MRRLLRPDTLISVPLYVLLGFCEDYKRVVINAHELILIRARNDNNYLIGDRDPASEPTLELFKVQWRIPHVLLSEINKLSKALRALKSGRFCLSTERIKSGIVDVRLDFECKENVPANTTAYCFIIYDRVVHIIH